MHQERGATSPPSCSPSLQLLLPSETATTTNSSHACSEQRNPSGQRRTTAAQGEQLRNALLTTKQCPNTAGSQHTATKQQQHGNKAAHRYYITAAKKSTPTQQHFRTADLHRPTARACSALPQYTKHRRNSVTGAQRAKAKPPYSSAALPTLQHPLRTSAPKPEPT